jgi:hypothetical protein
MFGDVRQKAAHGGRQTFPANPARLWQYRGVEGPDGCLGVSKRPVHSGEQIFPARARRFVLALQFRPLFGAELAAF